LTVVFLDEQLHFHNIRATIVEVVRAGLQRNLAAGAAAGGGLGSGGQIVLNGIVKSLLCAMISTSKRAIRVAKEAADLGVIAAEKRTAPNPSATLLGFHFTNTGEQLRCAPLFLTQIKLVVPQVQGLAQRNSGSFKTSISGTCIRRAVCRM
jgi:hypothetical protein